MMQILVQRVVRSVINLKGQTQGTGLPSVPQTKKSSPSHNPSALRTTLSSKIKWDSADDIHTGQEHNTPGWAKRMHWNSSWAHVDTNNFPVWLTKPWLPAAFDTISRKWILNVNLGSKGTPRIRRLFASSNSSPPRARVHHSPEHRSETG